MSTKHTPGPWRWEVNQKCHKIQLCGGKPVFDLTVMDFVRYGMQNAAPRFLTGEMNTLHRADEFLQVVPGREHHAHWFQTINHPDAKLIAAAPDLLQALQEVIDLIEPYSLGWDAKEAQDALQIARTAISKATL